MFPSGGTARGQEPSNRECPDHIGAVGTYVNAMKLQQGTEVIALRLKETMLESKHTCNTSLQAHL